MSKQKFNQIVEVMRTHDVRDPRGAMEAIEHILKAESLATKEPKPSLSIKVIDVKGVGIEVVLKHTKDVKPSAAIAAQEAIARFGQDTFGDAIRCKESGEVIGFEKYGSCDDIEVAIVAAARRVAAILGHRIKERSAANKQANQTDSDTTQGAN